MALWRTAVAVVALVPLLLAGMPLPAQQPSTSLHLLAPLEGDLVGSSLLVTGAGTGLEAVTVALDDGAPFGTEGSDDWSHLLDLSGTTNGSHRIRVEGLRQGLPPLVVERNVSVDLTPPTALEVEVALPADPPRVDQSLTVTGFVTTDVGVRVQQGDVTLSWPSSGASWVRPLDALGAFAGPIVAPSRPGPTTLRVSVAAPGLNLSAAAERTIEVRPALGPDLQVQSLTTDAGPVIANYSVNLTVRLASNGTQSVDAELRLYDGGTSPEELVAARSLTLSPGLRHQVIAYTPRTSGNHTLTVQLNSELEDPLPADNERRFPLLVEARPDLDLSELRSSTDEPHAGQALSLRLRLRNVGDAAVTFRLVVEAYPQQGQQEGPPVLVVSAAQSLLPGQEKVLSGAELRWVPSAGSWRLVARATGSAPADPNGANDQTEMRMDVPPPPPEKPKERPIPGPGVVLAALAIALGGLLRHRGGGPRRRSERDVAVLARRADDALASQGPQRSDHPRPGLVRGDHVIDEAQRGRDVR